MYMIGTSLIQNSGDQINTDKITLLILLLDSIREI